MYLRVDVEPAVAEDHFQGLLLVGLAAAVDQALDYCARPQALGVDERPVEIEEEGLRLHFPLPQHFLYFLPLPHGQGSLRPIFGSSRTYSSPVYISPSMKRHSPSIFLK